VPSSNPREAARGYAHSFHWSLLALWPPAEGFCTCPLTTACPSPGKHPHAYSRSVYGATSDTDEIAAWPSDVNVGVALGAASNGLMVLDIDQPEVADKLIEGLKIARLTAVARTGRGTHIYFHSSGPTNGFNLSDQQGNHLGEVRGDHQYVAVPPSLHVSGKRYEWLSLAKLESTYDPKRFITGLLLGVGCEPVLSDSVAVHVPEAQFEPRPLPYSFKNNAQVDSNLRGYAFGNWRPEAGAERSDLLYELGMLIAEAYEVADVAATPEDIAANLWWLHNRLEMRKYSGPKEFLRIALKAAVKHDTTLGGVDAEHADDHLLNEDGTTNFMVSDQDPQQLITPPGDGDYRWVEEDQKLYLYRALGNQRTPRAYEVCNFEPVLMTEYIVDDGEEQTRSWRVHLMQEGFPPYEAFWHEEDRVFGRLSATLTKLPARFTIRADMHKHIMPATVKLAEGRYEEESEHGHTGWIDYGPDGSGLHAFLLPGAVGAIHADGVDPEVRIRTDLLPDESVVAASPELAPYGRGVRPPVTEAEETAAVEAFLHLLACSPSRGKTTAIVLQVLAGPLIPSGAGETPPLMHVRGSTGTFKTSFCVAALSMFGTWIRDLVAPPTTWGSTPVFLQAMLHGAKDLTLLIDDYKKGVIDQDRQIIRMIQQYADRTSRGRANQRGGITTSKLPRGLILSNGEDVWGSVASVEARTIEFTIGKEEIDRLALDVAQRDVMRGDLQLFGGAWIQWLARNWEPIMDEGLVRRRRDEWRERLVDQHEGTHLRVITQVAVLAAVGDVLVDFIADTWPEHTETVREAVLATTTLLAGGVAERAELIKEAAPFRQLAIAVNEALNAGEALLKPRGHSTESLSEQTIPPQVFHTVPVVGYHFSWNLEQFGTAESKTHGERWREGETLVLLTEKTAFKFFLQQARATAVPPSFTWKSVLLDGIENHGAVRAERVRVRGSVMSKGSQISGIVVSLAEISEMTDEQELTQGGHTEQRQSGNSQFDLTFGTPHTLTPPT